MLHEEDLLFMLRCLHLQLFNEKFTELLEGIIETHHELTLILFSKNILSLINDRIIYEINGFISFLEEELHGETLNYSFT